MLRTLPILLLTMLSMALFAAPAEAAISASITGANELANPQFQDANAGIVFYNPAQSGTFELTVTATDGTFGIASVDFPDLGPGWTGGGPGLGGGPYTMAYSFVPGAVPPAALSITVTNNNADTQPVPLTIIADAAAPTGGAATHPTGLTNSFMLEVTFSTGGDAGSGIDSWQVQRRSATAVAGTCGSFGGFGVVGSSPGSPFTDFSLTNDQCYGYRLVVTDRVGNSEFINGSGTVIADLLSPTGTINSTPIDPLRGTPTIAGTSADNNSVAGATVTYTGPMSGTVCAGVTPSVWIAGCAWNTTGLTDGTYTLELVVTDGAGNSSGVISRVVVVDNSPPSVSFTAPASPQSGLIALGGSSGDAETMVAGVVVTYDGPGDEDGSACSDTDGTYWSCTWSSVGRTNGTYSLTATSTDAAGNTSTAVRSIDLLGPQVTSTPSGGTTDVEEGGATDTYTVVLDTAPTMNVTVTLSPSAQVLTDVPTLTFTTGDWNVPQVVTVSAVDDALDEASPHAGSVAASVSSSDLDYDGIAVASVAVDVIDNDVAGVTTTPSGGTNVVSEAGVTSDTVAVVLDSEPTADVTVTPSGGSQLMTAPTSLTFTTSNWATPQVVTATAVDDLVDEVSPHASPLEFAVTSADPTYAGLAVAGQSFAITDNDVAGFLRDVSNGATNVSEDGETDTFELSLASEPTANVTVTITGLQATPQPSSLTFTAADWNTPQEVTVSAIDDSDDEGPHDGPLTFSVASTDAAYSSLVLTELAVSITDNDAPTDGTVPVASVMALPIATLASSVRVRWSATDSGGGDLTFSLQSRSVSGFGGGAGTWTTLGGPTTSTSRIVGLKGLGRTHCFRVVATDASGNESDPSTQRCTAVPYDDRVWPVTRTWKRFASGGSYRGTATRSTSARSFLKLGVTGRRFGVLVTRCPNCGTLKVKLGARTLGTVNLKGRLKKRVVVMLPSRPSITTSTLKFEVSSASGKPVIVDGVLVFRA